MEFVPKMNFTFVDSRIRQILLTLTCGLTASFLFTSCTLPRRKPLEPGVFTRALSTSPQDRLVVKLEESLPGKPLNETVWDNVSGPLWDVKESKQIGFTQHYKSQFYAIPPALLPAAAQSGMHLINSQIVIPFGNIFSNMFASAIRKHFSQALICGDAECVRRSAGIPLLTVKIDRFLVWEAPLNHLNFYVKGNSSYSESGGVAGNYEFERSMLGERLGSLLSTHSKFIDEMNKLSNAFAEGLTAEIIERGLAKPAQ